MVLVGGGEPCRHRPGASPEGQRGVGARCLPLLPSPTAPWPGLGLPLPGATSPGPCTDPKPRLAGGPTAPRRCAGSLNLLLFPCPCCWANCSKIWASSSSVLLNALLCSSVIKSMAWHALSSWSVFPCIPELGLNFMVNLCCKEGGC